MAVNFKEITFAWSYLTQRAVLYGQERDRKHVAQALYAEIPNLDQRVQSLYRTLIPAALVQYEISSLLQRPMQTIRNYSQYAAAGSLVLAAIFVVGFNFSNL